MNEPAGLVIREERIAERAPLGRLLRDAFGRADEEQLTAALRRDGDMLLGLVGEIDGDLAGCIHFSRVVMHVAGDRVWAVSLAPLAVAGPYRKRGIGAALVEKGLALLRAQGERIVFVIGDPAYYRRFGFSSTEARKFICPWSKEAGEAHMVLALRPAALNGIIGTVSYGRAFAPFIPAGEPPG